MREQDSRLRIDTPDRAYYIDGPRYYVRVTFSPGALGGRGHWTAVELDDFGGFRRRLYDGREDEKQP